jgi:hypothetical protein
LWEVVELAAKKLTNSYILFGTDNDGGMETVENIVLLDLGNGVIGAIIGVLTLLTFPPKIKQVNFWGKWIVFLAYGILFSYFSSLSHCENSLLSKENVDCEPPYVFPWGIPLNIVLTYLYGYFYLSNFVNKEVVYAMMLNATVFLLGVSIRWESSAITTYISSGLLIVYLTIRYFVQRNDRKPRKDYDELSGSVNNVN